MAGVEYQVTKVDPTNPETKGAVYQVNKVTEEVAATLGGKVYRAKVIKNPSEPTVKGKVYQIVIVNPDTSTQGKVYNAIITGDSEAVVVGPAVSPLELPDAIADSLQYVKAFGGTEQRSTPSQYQQVKYVTNTSSTVLNTGIVFNFAKNYQMEIRARAVSGSWYMFQSRKTSSGEDNQINGLSGSQNTLAISANFNGTQATSNIIRTVGNILYVKMTAINGVLTLYVRDETANTEDTVTGTYTVEDVDALSWVGLWGNKASNKVDVNADVYMAKIIEDGVTVLDYVPCLNVATAGFYDKVSGTFKTTTGLSAALNPVPTPDAPIDIWCNNGMIKVRRKSGLPLEYRPVEYLMSTDVIDLGVKTTNNSVLEGKFMRVESAAQYLWQSDSGSSLTTNTTAYITSGSANWRFGQRTANISTEIDTLYEARQNRNGVYLNDVKIAPYTTVNEFTSVKTLKAFGGVYNPVLKIYYITLRTWGDLELEHNWIPCERIVDGVLGFYDIIGGTFHTNAGATITAGSYVADELELYIDGTQETIAIKDDNNTTVSTAVAQNLFAIDDYIDEQEIITGAITRKIGIKVFDGTENWAKAAATTGSNTFYIPRFDGKTDIANMICTHATVYTDATWVIQLVNQCTMRGSSFLFSNMDCADATEFKNWLTAQYAAGTPVIVVYPLATETTETVTGQTLQVQAGDNTLEITQASMSGLELEAKYDKEGA